MKTKQKTKQQSRECDGCRLADYLDVITRRVERMNAAAETRIVKDLKKLEPQQLN